MAKHALPLCLAAVLSVAGCADTSVEYPALLPTDQLLAEPAIPGHAEIAASSPDQVRSDLESAGAALGVSSAQITAEATTSDSDLARRAEALRRRADALSDSDLSCEDPVNPESC